MWKIFLPKKKKVLWKILTQTRLKDLSPSKISQMVKRVEHRLKKKGWILKMGWIYNYEQNFIWALIMDPPKTDKTKLSISRNPKLKRKFVVLQWGQKLLEEIGVGESLSSHKYTHSLCFVAVR